MRSALRRPGVWLLASLLTAIIGCGTLGEATLQSGEATLRTLVDLLLTDFANQVADHFESEETPTDGEPTDGEPTDDGDMDDDDDGDDGGDTAITRGQTLVADNCAACHGDDGASGFAANIQGLDQTTMAEAVAGEGGHTTIDLSEQNIADITEYLNSFDGGGNGGDAARGETLVANNCAVCHGADGASGFAPNIQGKTVEEITDRTGGADGHTIFDLSEQDIADIAAFLE